MDLGHFAPRDPAHADFIDAVALAARDTGLTAVGLTKPGEPSRYYLGVYASQPGDTIRFALNLHNLVSIDPALHAVAEAVGPPHGIGTLIGDRLLVAFYWSGVEIYRSQPWGTA